MNKAILTISDSRINRDNSFGGYSKLCQEIVRTATGYDKEFKGGIMAYNEFSGTAYKKTNFDDVQIDITLNFNSHEATIEISGFIPKPDWMKDLEMSVANS